MAFEQTLKKDWYSILGADPSANVSDLKQKYQKLILLYHPDKQSADVPAGTMEECMQKFIEIDQAWKILGNEETKKKYDLQRHVEVGWLKTKISCLSHVLVPSSDLSRSYSGYLCSALLSTDGSERSGGISSLCSVPLSCIFKSSHCSHSPLSHSCSRPHQLHSYRAFPFCAAVFLHSPYILVDKPSFHLSPFKNLHNSPG
ncbi:dnaJ homolog subfamily C member 24 isoform X1 [Meriones unguiculatus]|uniref:dnaJ homolog subfamily C member 24 isoform X1 n=1 Tax=Meriones unguiculatus TaxID=10047 RepID=UPI00293EE044|nr:dnaJ homolog subfamily C member 24 isoform X1 [Meriones unguiculatus]XP_060227731.1 dnaJ homolog subfamily C member 24 isoform X1 [Meriones unguiculatus]